MHYLSSTTANYLVWKKKQKMIKSFRLDFKLQQKLFLSVTDITCVIRESVKHFFPKASDNEKRCCKKRDKCYWKESNDKFDDALFIKHYWQLLSLKEKTKNDKIIFKKQNLNEKYQKLLHSKLKIIQTMSTKQQKMKTSRKIKVRNFWISETLPYQKKFYPH